MGERLLQSVWKTSLLCGRDIPNSTSKNLTAAMHGQDRVLVCAVGRKTAEAIDEVSVQFPLRQAHADRGGTQSVFG
jgi:hypothetical protein